MLLGEGGEVSLGMFRCNTYDEYKGPTKRKTGDYPQASGFPPCPYLQLGSPHPSISPNVEARSSDLYS